MKLSGGHSIQDLMMTCIEVGLVSMIRLADLLRRCMMLGGVMITKRYVLNQMS